MKNSNLFIVDRVKEIIKYQALQVSPSEIESVLMTHSSVVDAAVVGRPAVEDGQLPTAFIVKKPDHNVTAEELSQHVANHLISYKWLRGGVIFVDAIPRAPSGKILRRKLVNLLESTP